MFPISALAPQKDQTRHLAILFSAVAVAMWVGLAATVNPAQFGDNIEQYNWAHSLQWGYWKHPPLPTFILGIVIKVAGPSVYWTYWLAALCFIGTVFFTSQIAARLLGTRLAVVVAILLALHFGFSWRAQIYNHNTVLLFLIAAIVWTTMLAAEARSLVRWILAGCLAGLAMLTKYQAAVPLMGILVALWLSGALKEKRNRLGVGLALLTACAVFLPHLMWLIANDFLPFQYAKNSAKNLSVGARLNTLLSFAVIQIRFHLVALVSLLLVYLFVRFRKTAEHVENPAIKQDEFRAWMWGLIGFPALFLGAMLLLGGVRLESHWGLQTFQFFMVWLAWRFRSLILRTSLNAFFIVALLVHAIAMGFYWNSIRPHDGKISGNSTDRVFPAKALAAAALNDWKASTSCPLKYVAGPSFESGLISVYSGYAPVVFEQGDPIKSPWVDLNDLRQSGAVQVRSSLDDMPANVTKVGSMQMPGRGDKKGSPVNVYWGIVLPQHTCGN